MPISEIEHVRNMIVASISLPASYADILAHSLTPENNNNNNKNTTATTFEPWHVISNNVAFWQV